MNDAMTIAASGMQAAMRAFTTHAANVVNADAPAASQSAAGGNVYQPTTIVQGQIPIPNSDSATEIVGTIQAANSFRADLAVFQTSARMFKSLLDTLA